MTDLFSPSLLLPSLDTVIAHLTTQRNAIDMLHKRIQFLYKYLEDAKSGVIPLDHSITRQISSICRRSPVVDINAFDEQFSTVIVLYYSYSLHDID